MTFKSRKNKRQQRKNAKIYAEVLKDTRLDDFVKQLEVDDYKAQFRAISAAFSSSRKPYV